MPTTYETLRVLKLAEDIADSTWKNVTQWDEFAKDVLGKQLIRASDLIGANSAESFGRFNFGEKLQFLYFARGSLFETKYWLKRARTRELMSNPEAQVFFDQLTDLARQLNAFASGIKTLRANNSSQSKSLREIAAAYTLPEDFPDALFTDDDLAWLAAQ